MGMRLGTETNSLVNNLLSRATLGQPAPQVGMGVTILNWTDRSAGTIQKVTELSGKRWKFEIEVTEDEAKRIDKNGMSESQEYEYTQQPDGPRTIFRCERKSGEWVRFVRREDGRGIVSRGPGLGLGYRKAYFDFSF